MMQVSACPLLPAAVTQAHGPESCGLVPVDVAETFTHPSRPQ